MVSQRTWSECWARVALALIASMGISQARAQGAPGGPHDPPLRQTVDGNGVDLYAGKMVVSSPTISIGAGGGVLSYGIIFRGNQWRHSFIGGIYAPDTTTLASVTVNIGEHAAHFTKSGGAYTASQVTNGTLTQDPTTLSFTYTMMDGTVAVFTKGTGISLGSQFDGFYAVLSSVTLPSGERLDYQYQVLWFCTQNPVYCASASRLSGIQSTRGYAMEVTYASNDGTVDPVGAMRVTRVKLTNRINSAASGMPQLDLAYDASGVQFTDAANRTSRVNTSIATSITSVRNPGSASNNLVVTYTSGKVSSINNNGLITNYSYSTSGGNSITTVNRPGGAQEVYTFSSPYRLISFKDGLNRTTSYTYDNFSRLDTVTTPGDVKTTYQYDSRWNVTGIQYRGRLSSGGPILDVASGFDATCSNPKTCNKPNWTRDANGNITDYTYDSTHGSVLTVTQPAPSAGQPRPQIRYSYSALEAWYKNSGGTMVASGAPIHVLTQVSTCRTSGSCTGTLDEMKTVIGYGPTAGGRNLWPIDITTQSGDGAYSSAVAKGYDLVGNEVSFDGPLAGPADLTMARYDVLRRPTGSIAPDPDGAGGRPQLATRIAYDALGRAISYERGTVTGYTDTAWNGFTPQDSIGTTYDSADRPTKETYMAGGVAESVKHVTYDAASRIECVAVRMNKAAFGSAPASACSAGTPGDFGPDRITQFNYDAANQVIGVTSALGVTGEQLTDGRAYELDGMVSDFLDGNGNRTKFEYDGFGRLNFTYYPDKVIAGEYSEMDFERLDYIGTRIVQKRTRANKVIGFGYDNLDRIIFRNVPDTDFGDVYYSYDNHGRPLSARFGSSAGPGNVYTYDGLGRLASTTSYGRTLSYQYSPAGLRNRITYPDGFYASYGYTTVGELDTVNDSAGNVLARFSYDNLGRRIRLDRGAVGSGLAATVYGHNAASQLTALTHDLASTANDRETSYGYSPAGQIASMKLENPSVYAWKGAYTTSRSYGINGLNQVTSIGATSLGYDTKGNLTSGDPAWTFLYDAENRLATATPTSGSNTVTIQYDPEGLIHQIDQYGAPSTAFLFDGGNLVAEYNEQGTLLRRYVPAPGLDQPLVWYEGTGSADRRWFHADERGSIVAVSNTSGVAVATIGYSPYGEMTISGYSRFRYTGQPYISELGMHYYKARFYSSPLGRFLQPDPIGYEAGPNLYAYVSGDPVNRVDPWGANSILVTAPRLPNGSCDGVFTRICGYDEFSNLLNLHYALDRYFLSQLSGLVGTGIGGVSGDKGDSSNESQDEERPWICTRQGRAVVGGAVGGAIAGAIVTKGPAQIKVAGSAIGAGIGGWTGYVATELPTTPQQMLGIFAIGSIDGNPLGGLEAVALQGVPDDKLAGFVLTTIVGAGVGSFSDKVGGVRGGLAGAASFVASRMTNFAVSLACD